MPSPANLLTDFILRQSYADLPEPIRHQAKRCLLDSMGACPPVRSRRWPA